MDKIERGKLKNYQAISEHLRSEIVSSRYPYGAALPTVRALGQVYEVSPQTISKALNLLVEEKYIQTKRGSGSVVIYKDAATRKGGILMLVDSNRSRILSDREDPVSYHSKDIYLSYLLHMNQVDSYSKILVYEREAEQCEESLCREIKDSEGLIIQGCLPECYFHYIQDLGIPTVNINRPIPDYLSKGYWGEVLIGHAKIDEAMNYIVSLGHEKILFPVPLYLSDVVVLEQRFRYFQEAADKASGGRTIELVRFPLSGSPQDNTEALKSYIQKGFTASVGFNDVVALEIYRLLAHLGKRIPEDFSVIGFDDIFAAQLGNPPLTTIKVPRSVLVDTAFRILEKLQNIRMRGDKLTALVEEVDCSFVIRGSSYVRRR